MHFSSVVAIGNPERHMRKASHWAASNKSSHVKYAKFHNCCCRWYTFIKINGRLCKPVPKKQAGDTKQCFIALEQW